jgi:hypothetical protein
MQETNEDLLKQLTNETPFRIREGQTILLENRNANCTHSQINSMLNKGLLNPIDMEIVTLLSTYQFLNTHNITYHLNHLSGLSEHYKKDDYARNLKKMTKAGILARYCVTNSPSDENDTLEGSVLTRPAGPLRFYDLTPGSYSYISPIVEHPHNSTAATDDSRKLELLALNQFLMRFERYYGEYILHSSYLATRKVGSQTLTIDTLLKYRVTNELLNERRPLSIFVFSIRQTGDFLGKLTRKLKATFQYLHNHQCEFPFFTILILVENIVMMTEIHARMQMVPELIGQTLYFAPDTLSSIHPPLECLYTCKDSESDGRIYASRHKIMI